MWDKGLEIVEREWRVIVKAPVVFTVALLLVSVGLWLLLRWYYSDHIEELKDRIAALQENVTRYRIAAGLDKPSPKTTMTELTNSELKQKTEQLVTRIREIVSIHDDHENGLTLQYQNKQITQEKFDQLFKEEMKRAWRQFESIRVEALMAENELRARTSSTRQEQIVTAAPHFSSADDPNAEITFNRLITGPFSVEHAFVLADTLEELSKLQLKKLEACKC